MRKLSIAVAMISASLARATPTPPMTPDIPPSFTPAAGVANFERREVMIPMRDGVKLKTFVIVPRGAKRAPIVLSRTPYNAAKRAELAATPTLATAMSASDDIFADGTYVRAYQDVRGKYGSEGDYVMTRPLRGPLNATAIDHATDAYDTIDWLVKNVPETNGKVAIIGSSYEGYTAMMALVKPHPALAAAIPMCPMVDGWKGDDWFHNGAFRQVNFDFFYQQTTVRGEGKVVPRKVHDDYEMFRRAGSAGDYAKLTGIDQLPIWKKFSEHPNYDAYWREQAVDKLLAAQPLSVPVMIVGGQWDQEDSYGATALYAALEPKDKGNDKVFLVLGPWSHSQQNHDATKLGPLKWGVDTAAGFRRDVVRPFLDARLKDVGTTTAKKTSPVVVYETGTNKWVTANAWPRAPATKAMYLGADGKLGWVAPKAEGSDEYVSDPGKPVPYIPRPLQFGDRDAWRTWLVSDQRGVVDRPDVLSWSTDALTAPVHVAGAPVANLFAATTGTDADWVVKVIDVYPDDAPGMAGYQLPIAMEIFRGRYRESFETPKPIAAGVVSKYRFALPHVDHVFLPGHRIMIQVQSSWFPLYDRNPQTYVENVMFAKPGDYRKATHRISRSPSAASAVELPVLP